MIFGNKTILRNNLFSIFAFVLTSFRERLWQNNNSANGHSGDLQSARVLLGKPVAEAHRTAVQVSAFVCMQNGAMPPCLQSYGSKMSAVSFQH